MTLRLCSDLSAADWLAGSDLRWDKLVTFGPSGFAAYARLLLLPQYPGQSEDDAATDEALPAELEQLRAVVHVLADHTRTPDDCYFCLGCPQCRRSGCATGASWRATPQNRSFRSCSFRSHFGPIWV